MAKDKPGIDRYWTDDKLNKLGKELIACMSEPGVWHISEFSERYERADSWLYDLFKRYPEVMAEYHQRAKRILGRKMHKQALEKNPDKWLIKTFMPRMLGVQKEANEHLANEELIKAEAKIKALKKELQHKGEILDYINGQKKIDEIME
jgi:hypothetical protein